MLLDTHLQWGNKEYTKSRPSLIQICMILTLANWATLKFMVDQNG